MKKCFWNRIVSCILVAGLALTMGAGLCACKKTQKKTKISGRVITADDPYYTSESLDLSIPVDASKALMNYWLYGSLITDDMVLCNYNISYQVPSDLEKKMQAYSQNPSSFSVEEAEKLQEEYDSYQDNGYAGFDLAGNLLFKKQGGELGIGFFVGPSGEPMQLDNRYDPKTQSFSSVLVGIQKDGTKKDVLTLVGKDGKSAFGGSSSYKIKGLPDGRFIAYNYGIIKLFGKDGKEIFTINAEEFVGALYAVGDEVWASCRHYEKDEETPAYIYLEKVDTVNGMMSGQKVRVENISGEGMIIEGVVSMDGDEKFIVKSGKDGEKSLFYLDGNGIRKVDLTGKEESSLFVDWNDVDMNRYGLISQGASIREDDILLIRNRSGEHPKQGYVNKSTMNVQLVKIKKAAQNPFAGRTVIELGNRKNNDEYLLDLVLEYNRMPDHKVRIDVHDYSQDVSNAGAFDKVISGVEDQIYMDLLAGGGPDILANFQDAAQFSSDKLVLDLNALIDASDRGLDRSRYYDNVLRSFEIGGKLYHIPVCTDVYGFLGNTKLVGESRTIPFSELLALKDSISGKSQVFPDLSYERMLDVLLPGSFAQFLDAANMKLNVENEEFQSILNVMRALGRDPQARLDDSIFDDWDHSTPENMLQAELVALIPTTISTPAIYHGCLEMCSGKAGMFGVEKGFSAGSDLTLAISKNTSYPQECWDFIRFLMEKDTQENCGKETYSIPIHREAVDEFCKESALSPEETLSFKSMLESVYTARMSNYSIKEIILEEAMAYFCGQKGIQDVCEIIQNRVNTYMKEQYSLGLYPNK